jgi:hypothetical protein
VSGNFPSKTRLATSLRFSQTTTDAAIPCNPHHAVDCNRRNLELFRQFLEKEGYQTRVAANSEKFDQSLAESSDRRLGVTSAPGKGNIFWMELNSPEAQRITIQT